VKARDGETDIYGVLYRPTNFDPARKYPVIDNIYTGPHYVMAPKSFNRALYREAQATAELGFILINIDGLGTARRSREFHSFSYMNLADGGIPDHIAGMQQLAENYTYMDLDRVGIFGFSAGGYDTAHAMFAHGDFYKVGVAASGNYDHRMDKAWWNELWMDYPVKEHYIEQSCLTIAHQLQGKLLLAHGEVDENVNPYNTIRLANELIKANKDFDLIIMPNKMHYLGDDPYFIRRRWDFFVKHLQGVEPPQGYRIKEFEKE
jgi:dipeptidyl aminopeptidase/acylaminoacyl peptidase